MQLPAAVQKKALRANELMAAAAAARVQPAPVAKPAPARPAPQAPAANEGDQTQLRKLLEDTQEKLRLADERYKSLEGKYNAETPRAQREAREAKEEAEKLRKEMKELAERQAQMLKDGTVESLSADERRMAGEDIVRVATKIAAEVAGRTFDTRIGTVTQRIDLFDKQTEEAYWATLETLCPTWEVVNEDKAFLSWLHQPDPKTGAPRLDRLKRGEAARQGHLVAEIFNAYLQKREIGATLVPSATEPGKPAALEARADGGSGGGDVVIDDDSNAGKPKYTRAQIRAHYSNKTRGEWKGREDEWRKIEVDMFAAQREGRVSG